MKRLTFILAAVLSLGMAVSSFAVTRTVMVVDDVIKMSKAGVADDEIIAFVQKSRDAFDVNADDVIAMTDANVSRAVIRAVVDEANVRRQDADRAEARSTDRGRSTVYVSPRVVVGSPYYYDPFYYGWYDPFWYGPRVSLNFGFGYRGGFRGGYRGGYHGGGHRGRH